MKKISKMSKHAVCEKTRVIGSNKNVIENYFVVDIGPKTVALFTATLNKCKTVFWNGPMGVYEIPQFARGSIAMAQLLAGLKASTVIGGGSTADMVYDMKLADKMTFVSTGGGASMSFLSGEVLPGVEALSNKK